MIDWHDDKFIEAEKKRVGPGEQGLAFDLTDVNKEYKAQLYSVNGFNAAASRKIPVDRALSDIRHPGWVKFS